LVAKRLPILGRDEAMDLAFRLLARRAHSRAELAAALAGRGASRSMARSVLGRLRALGYVDDRKLAAECAEHWKNRGFGSLRIREQLRRLGVEERIVEDVTDNVREERARAREVLARRFAADELTERQGIARAARFLTGRGFPGPVIDSLLDLWE
jgi:regulatory protein